MEELTLITKTNQLVELLGLCRKTVQKRLKDWKLDDMFVRINQEGKKKHIGYIDKKELLKIVLKSFK